MLIKIQPTILLQIAPTVWGWLSFFAYLHLRNQYPGAVLGKKKKKVVAKNVTLEMRWYTEVL